MQIAESQMLLDNHRKIAEGVTRLTESVSRVIEGAPIRQEARRRLISEYEAIKKDLATLVSDNEDLVKVLTTENRALSIRAERLARNGAKVLYSVCGLVVCPSLVAVTLWIVGAL